MTPAAKHLEAMLFVAGDAVAKRELGELARVTSEELTTLLGELRDALVDHGLMLIETATHVQLTTAPAVSAWLAEQLSTAAAELSAAAAETLALVAYRGPMSRADIDGIRGVDSRRMVGQLLARGLIRQAGPGLRPARYAVTEEFLQHLGIADCSQLPDFERLTHESSLTPPGASDPKA